jgi:hypothetical protein
MERQIESAVKRSRAYWFVDGLTEMVAGALFLALGAAVLLFAAVPPYPMGAPFSSLINVVSLIKLVGIAGGILLLWWAKDRFTFPRTGFVRVKIIPRGRILLFLGILVLIVLVKLSALAVLFSLAPSVRGWIFSLPVWLPVGVGALWALLFAGAGIWLGLRRFYVIGAWVLAAGIGVGIWQGIVGVPSIPLTALTFHLEEPIPAALQIPLAETIGRLTAGIGWLTLAAGAAFFLSGVITFLRYRKENPVPVREEA